MKRVMGGVLVKALLASETIEKLSENLLKLKKLPL